MTSAFGGDFVECRCKSRLGGLGRCRRQFTVAPRRFQFGLQRIRRGRLTGAAGRCHRPDEGECQQAASAVGEKPAAGQQQRAAAGRAGIWVEHANILPLPHALLAYRW
jgi:hypothetical protein